MAYLKNYLVRHVPKYSRTWLVVGYFESMKDALSEFNELHTTYPGERVWVVEMDTDHVIADSHPPRRR